MNDRDCESCKKFSRVDPIESEGYCEAKRTWVDPEEGEDCKMHEFTLHSATKYKDGTPIMSEPEKVYWDTDSAPVHGKSTGTYAVRKAAVNAMYGKTFTEFAKTQDDLIEEYEHRICNLEHLYEQLISKLCAIEQHNGSNFCGNCTHAEMKDGICGCELLRGIVDPDSASCSMFEPPF